jgi:hypothetical protein
MHSADQLLSSGVKGPYTKDERAFNATGTLSLVDRSDVPAVPTQNRSASFKKTTCNTTSAMA